MTRRYIEFSRRYDGKFNIWRRDSMFGQEETEQFIRHGWDPERLSFWNLIDVKEDRPSALAFVQSYRKKAA